MKKIWLTTLVVAAAVLLVPALQPVAMGESLEQAALPMTSQLEDIQPLISMILPILSLCCTTCCMPISFILSLCCMIPSFCCGVSTPIMGFLPVILGKIVGIPISTIIFGIFGGCLPTASVGGLGGALAGLVHLCTTLCIPCNMCCGTATSGYGCLTCSGCALVATFLWAIVLNLGMVCIGACNWCPIVCTGGLLALFDGCFSTCTGCCGACLGCVSGTF